MATPKPLVIGFSDSPSFARRVAKRLGCRTALVVPSTFPSGELRLRLPSFEARRLIVVSDISERPDSLLRVLALAQALSDRGARHITLLAPWIAYGRQDRMTKKGEAPVGIAVGRAVSRAFDRIMTLEAHSDAFRKSFGGKLSNVLPDATAYAGRLDLVAAPDRGAAHRAERVAGWLRLPLLVVEKRRHGRTVTACVDDTARSRVLPGARTILVDDIGDSGATLAAAASAFHAIGVYSVRAVVTHAIDLAALRRTLGRHLSSVQATYDHATGRMSPAALAPLIEELKKSL